MKIKLAVRKELHRLWLTHYFLVVKQGELKITRKTELGKLLCATVKYSEVKVQDDPELGDFVLLHLPSADNLRLAPTRYIYFDRETQLRLQDLIEVFFNIDFDRYYLHGQQLGMMKKDIIESFIISRNLTSLMSDNEMLKKRKYREELETFHKQVEVLRQKAYYRNDRISVSLQNKSMV